MMKKKFYISTAIAYPNAKPHMGHALEFIQLDCLARYHRMLGEDVFASTGTDEHGVKIVKTAKQEGLTAQELVDRNSKYFLDIYDKCPNHDRKPDYVEEENYFFRLSKYKSALQEKLKNNEIKIYPESRKQEILNVLEELGDVSFSRPKSVLPWGVTVPSDNSHVMYVWCDALSNYLTGLDYLHDGENFKKYWPNDINIIGKDITRFHALYWPAMLMSAGLPLPKKIMVHGFLTSEGQKMSKTLGNVVDPIDLIEKYGTDAVRYYLLREVPTLDDGDFSEERFFELYQSELANSLGNLVNRVSSMILRYLGSEISFDSLNSKIENNLESTFKKYSKYFEELDFKKAMEEIIKLIDFSNKYIEDEKPWQLAKENEEKLKQVLFDLVVLLEQIGILLYPYIPNKAVELLGIFGIREEEIKFSEKFDFRKNYSVKKGEVLFPRIEKI